MKSLLLVCLLGSCSVLQKQAPVLEDIAEEVIKEETGISVDFPGSATHPDDNKPATPSK